MADTFIRVQRDGAPPETLTDLDELRARLADPDVFAWIDVAAPDPDVMGRLAGELGLHELAVEDALGNSQRPKVDRYAEHGFVTVRFVRLDTDTGTLDETEIDAFVERRWIVTVREGDEFPLAAVVDRLDRAPELARLGPGSVLWAMLDVVADELVDTARTFDEIYDAVAESVFAGTPIEPGEYRGWFSMRRKLTRFFHVSAATRDVLATLLNHEDGMFPRELDPWMRDVSDHASWAAESAESTRELSATIAETNLTLREYRQNQIVKKVSSWAAIVTVPAFVTGYFGMNVPFPGSETIAGVIASTVIIAGSGVGLWFVFKRRDWL